mmetsp:Transcript_4547/g.4724  ORF Transcript_4547/g.4724 Transcript_4547/m.4724 type:complete len:305 (+) Transcript_4547:1602-2516(+)
MYEETRAEKEKIRDRFSQLNSQIEMFEVENTELSNKLSERVAQEKEAQEKLNKKSSEIDKLTKEKSSLEEYKAKCEQIQGDLNLRSKEIELISKNYSELEEMLKISKTRHDHDIELLQSNIHELTECNRSLENKMKEKEAELEKFTEKECFVLSLEEKSALDKKVVNLEIENKHLKQTRDKMKVYCDEIISKTKTELAEKQYLIDKRIVSNHFLKYFDKNVDWNIKNALIESLAKIFGFSNEERKKIGLSPLVISKSSSTNINSKSGKTDKEEKGMYKITTEESQSEDKLQKLSDLIYESILED